MDFSQNWIILVLDRLSSCLLLVQVRRNVIDCKVSQGTMAQGRSIFSGAGQARFTFQLPPDEQSSLSEPVFLSIKDENKEE